RVLSPSRSSTASLEPVDAPDGTIARPKLPSARVTSASRVGLPRLSRISRAWTLAMVVMSGSLQVSGLGFEEAVALGHFVDGHQRLQQRAHLRQRPGVGAV